MAPRKMKPPISEWIVRERKRMGLKPSDISDRLKAAGYEAEESTVQVWEAGRSPKAETIEALEKLFGSTAPRDQPPSDAAAAVLAAIDRQTQMLERQWQVSIALVANLTALVEEMRAGREDATQRDEALAQILAQLRDAALHGNTPVEPEPPRPGAARGRRAAR